MQVTHPETPHINMEFWAAGGQASSDASAPLIS